MLAASRMSGPAHASGFELASWYFFRLSGAMLLVLALGHIFITHYLNVPSLTNFSFVAQRYSGPLWRTFDWLLLVLALLHGLNGLRVVINDYIHPAGWRLFAQSVNFTLATIFIGLGSVTIFTFDPRHTANVRDLTFCHVIDGFLVLIAAVTYIGIIAGIVWLVRQFARGGPLFFYSGSSGQYAWALHRITGLGILAFLLIHIIDIMLLGLGSRIYNCTVSFYSNWIVLPMEIFLVLAVLYHSFNGIRLILVDFWHEGVYRQKEMWYAVVVLSILALLPSVYVILSQG